MIRSALAVLAGLAVITAASFAIEAGANPLFMRMFPETPPAQLAVNGSLSLWLFTMAYSLACVVAGGYVTAWLARGSPVRHAAILGVLQSALMAPAMMSFPDPGPLWRWVVGMVVVVPAACSGGVIYAKRRTARAIA